MQIKRRRSSRTKPSHRTTVALSSGLTLNAFATAKGQRELVSKRNRCQPLDSIHMSGMHHMVLTCEVHPGTAGR